jgi:hypothetical protein
MPTRGIYSDVTLPYLTLGSLLCPLDLCNMPEIKICVIHKLRSFKRVSYILYSVHQNSFVG